MNKMRKKCTIVIGKDNDGTDMECGKVGKETHSAIKSAERNEIQFCKLVLCKDHRELYDWSDYWKEF